MTEQARQNQREDRAMKAMNAAIAKSEQAAHDEGFVAFYKGTLAETRNPYQPSHSADAARRYRAWRKGWRKAQAENCEAIEAEQRFERRAAFGPGVELVNIVTGERFTS